LTTNESKCVVMFRIFKKEVIKTLKKVDPDGKYIKESEYADLASTVAFKIAKEENKNAEEVAENVISHLSIESDYIGAIEAVRGYINFFVSSEYLEDTISVILDTDENYGSLRIGGEVLIEHTSANPDGPLHIGHIRNAIIGDTLARIFRKAGMNVRTQYYVNDMGKQIATAVLGVKKFGLDQNKKKDHAVAEAYIKINKEIEKNPEIEKEMEELMVKYENLDEKVVEEFKSLVNFVLDGVKQTLEELKVKHDEFVWESDFIKNNYVNRLFRLLEEKKLIEKEEAWYIPAKKLNLEKDVVLRRKNKTTLYLTRDLAYHLWKNENYERFINVLGSDHKLEGKELCVILETLGFKKPEIIFFEFVSLPEGSMSTRKGVYISADEVIEKTYKEAYKLLKERDFSENEKKKIAKEVAISSLRYDFIKVSPEKPMTFDLAQALDFEKQTASYIQYSYARACSILRKAVKLGMPDLEFSGELCTKTERKLVVELSKFSYLIERVINELKPNLFAEYLIGVASLFNDFYKDHPVLKAPSEYRMHRLAIVDSTRIVLRNGMELLGITPLEKM